MYRLNNRNNQQNANNPHQGNAAGNNALQAQPAGGHAVAGEGAAAAIGFQPYIRPPMFAFKVGKLG